MEHSWWSTAFLAHLTTMIDLCAAVGALRAIEYVLRLSMGVALILEHLLSQNGICQVQGG